MKAITHRDQVHGDVRFDSLAVALLNTAPLQRLGRIYQLGYAHLVFRGGTHTRLSHVMGASHAASQLVDFLRQNYQEGDLPLGAVDPEEFLPVGSRGGLRDDRWDVLRHLVRWAALLHDLGHVPLGHTLEDEFDGIYVKHDNFASKRIPHLWHEISPGEDAEIRAVFRRGELLPESFDALGISGEKAWQTVMLICLHKESGKDGERRTFKDIIEASDEVAMPFVKMLRAALAGTEGRTYFPYMADIVGNTICADYLDYLRRDAINVGLDVLRDNRVASRFFVAKDAQGLFRMALALEDRHGKPRLDTCTGVVELVRQRFRFAEIIYYHKTKVAASAMLAKVFALIGNPEEVGPHARLIEVDQVPDLTKRIMSGEIDPATLRKECFPSMLLDPTIGDETLLLWLQDLSFERLAGARRSGDAEKVRHCLRGLSLLQSLVRRKLYKVCFTIDKNIYRELTPGSKEELEIERRIDQTLTVLRKNPGKRASLESKIAVAAGWPEDALLLYVPPRKSQAKGIETKALDRGDVVTLGSHSAVSEEVTRLNDSYKKLWRIILLVHPKFRLDAVGLSKAIDALILDLWPNIDLRVAEKGIQDGAMFQYIPDKQRPAALEYKRLAGEKRLDWKCFDEAGYNTADGTVSTEEHAERAMLLSLVRARGGSAETIKGQFQDPNSLSARVKELESTLTIEGREGTSDVRMAVIEKIASDLVPQQSDGKKTRRKRDAQLPLGAGE
jgi:HD superfamily phosphohydrolase